MMTEEMSQFEASLLLFFGFCGHLEEVELFVQI